jgi:nitrogen regulatory protein P-II 1
MREIKAIIQPFMLDRVLHAIEAIEGLPGVTVSQVLGWGKTRARGAQHMETVGGHTFAKKTKVEIVVSDDLADEVAAAIANAARTGKPGDGKIFVLDVVDVTRIRSGERGPDAV